MRAPVLRLGSSLRCEVPRRTLERGRALMPRMGISRLTDVTRMDFLGLPVFVSIRPRSLTLHVHAGKGIHSVDAQVGALMEAIEFASAEPCNSQWVSRPLRVGELESAWGGAFAWRDLAPSLDHGADADRPFETVACEDLTTDRSQPLPADLVFLPFQSPGQEGVLQTSSNGLASGNSVDEATLHGLLEVLERDAEAMDVARSHSLHVAIDELPPPFSGMAQAWLERGVALAVRYLPNVFGLPCFEAMLSEPATDVALAMGYGLHLERDIALSRAVCEAAQSRLSCIHGGRHDVARMFDRASNLGARGWQQQLQEIRAEKFDAGRRVRYGATHHVATAGRSIEELLGDLLERLRRRGFGTVLRHRFQLGLDGLEVVKVVVPRCANTGEAGLHIGPRLLGRILARRVHA